MGRNGRQHLWSLSRENEVAKCEVGAVRSLSQGSEVAALSRGSELGKS